MLLNTWAVRWNGHLIEVRNHFFLAELVIDGQIADEVPGVLRHDLRAAFSDTGLRELTRCCPDRACQTANRIEARFCALCGRNLDTQETIHAVSATVEFAGHFPPPSINCRIVVDGDVILKDEH